MENGYKDKKRPSGHDISDKFDEPQEDGSIPPNLIEAANTASNTHYLQACRELDIEPHPARFPRDIPEFFIEFLTHDPPYVGEQDTPVVLDIFAGSNMTGKVAEKFGRNWIAFEQQERYLQTSELRFRSMEEIKKEMDEDQSDFSDFAEIDD
jgi:site-specific DNA-methyltransferase (cytosine-N4-specific)